MKTLAIANHEINAILPCCTNEGSRTQIHTAGRETIYCDVKVKTVVQRLALRQTIDLRSLKSAAAKLTKSAIWQPLVLAPDLVLVPLKVCKPTISGDATGGYFNFPQILSTRAAENRTWIKLRSGAEIPVLWKHSTVEEHLQRAHLAALAQNNHMQLFENLARFFMMHTAGAPQKNLTS